MVSLVVQSYRTAHMCAELNYDAFTVAMSVTAGRPAAPLPVYETTIGRMTSVAIDRHDGPFLDRALHMMVDRDVGTQKNGTHTRVTRGHTHSEHQR